MWKKHKEKLIGTSTNEFDKKKIKEASELIDCDKLEKLIIDEAEAKAKYSEIGKGNEVFKEISNDEKDHEDILSEMWKLKGCNIQSKE